MRIDRLQSIAFLTVLLLVPGCGEVRVEEPPAAAAGGGGGSSVTSGTGGGSASSVGQGGAAPGACAGLGHAACLAAYPSCAPVYDDACCPSCEPTAGCADCIDIQFLRCENLADVCGPGTIPPCGIVPSWGCSGGRAECGPPEGSVTPCASVAGCVLATCDPATGCTPACHPVTAGSCANNCDSVPPPCPAGTTPENDGFCYTGFCIPTDVCD